MLSLDNTYSEEELREFEERIFRAVGKREIAYAAELKIDGLSMALHYERGRLVRAVTRGDGVRGDDVTAERARDPRDPARAAGGRRAARSSRRAARSTCRARASWRSTASARRPRRSRSRTRGTPPPGTMKSLDARVVEKRGLEIFLYSVAHVRGAALAQPVAGARAAARLGPAHEPRVAALPGHGRGAGRDRGVARRARARSSTRSTAWW